MATYYVELQGGALRPSAQFCGGDIYPGAGGGGGATLQTKSVSYTPTESAISASVTPDVGYDGMDQVNVSVGAISSTYVGSGIARNDSTDLTASGATVTAPAGYYASNGSKTIASAGTPEVYVATIESDGKITAQVDINNSGYIDADTYLATTPNAMVTPRSSTDLTASGATVTAPAGYYSANATKTIPNASAPELLALANINADGDVTVDVGIATSGYISSGNYVLTIENEVGAIGAQTYIPGTTDQEIDGHQWIAGTQTILGDADLVASNIKKDVQIFGVTGTYEGGGGGTDYLDLRLKNTLETYANNSVTTIPDYAFYGCSAITSVNFPNVTEIKQYAFYNVGTFTINLDAVTTIGTYAFYKAKIGTVIHAPLLATIAANAFREFANTETLVLPSAATIGNEAFRNNYSLKSVDIGEDITSLGTYVFVSDSALDTVVIRASAVPTLSNTNAFNSTKFASGGAGGTFYVPSSLISAYAAASNWSTLASRANVTFAAIEMSYYETHYADGTPIS